MRTDPDYTHRLARAFYLAGSGRKAGDGPLHEISDEGWDFTIRLNLSSLFYSNRAAVQQFLKQGSGGKDAIRAGLKMVLADPNVSLTFTPNSVDVAKSGDIAFSQGVYTMVTSDPKTKKPVTEKGTYVTTYKKQVDGSWKAVQDINTPEAPAK